MAQLIAYYNEVQISVYGNPGDTEVLLWHYLADGDELTAPADWTGYHGINSDEVDCLLEKAGYLLAGDEDEEDYWDAEYEWYARPLITVAECDARTREIRGY